MVAKIDLSVMALSFSVEAKTQYSRVGTLIFATDESMAG
jgi:hypothetical protein